MGRIALLATVTAVGLGIAACGGGGNAKQSFTADANRVCTQGPRDVVNLYLDRGLPSSPQAVYEFDRALVPVRARFLAGLRRLDPPAGQKKAYDRYLSLRETVLDLTKDMVVVDRKGDERAAASVGAKLEEVIHKAGGAAGQIGLDVCALKLSPGDAKAVRAVISEFEVTHDPQRACRDLATTQFINSRFPGGYAQCAAYVKKYAGTYAKSVDVSHVEGTNGVSAVVEYKDVGGKYGGTPDSATLFYVDGQWKIFSAQQEKSGGG
jgi:hypothetical protein